MKVKAIIFDLDGTLINSIPDIANSANRMLEGHKYPAHEVESYIKWVGNGAQKLIERALPEGLNEKEVIGFLNEYLDIYRNNCTVHTKPYDGIHDMLKFISEQIIRVAILTNKPHDITKKTVDFYFSDHHFDLVIGQREGYPKKPDPAVALHIAEKLDTFPGEILFVGDSDTDVKTAINAGMIPVGVLWGYKDLLTLKEAGCEFIINKPKQIKEILNNNF